MIFYFLIFYIYKIPAFPDSLFEFGKKTILEFIEKDYIREYKDSIEIFFENFVIDDENFWVEGTVYIKKDKIKNLKTLTGFSKKDINEAIIKFSENAITYLKSIFFESPEVIEIKNNIVKIKNGFLKGIRETETFMYGDLTNPSGFLKIKEVYENEAICKLLIKDRKPEKGEKLIRIRGIPYIYTLYLSSGFSLIETKKGLYGAEKNIKDGSILLYGLGFRLKIQEPFSVFYFNPGIFFYTSNYLESQKLSITGNYILNNLFKLGFSFDFLLIWQTERNGKEVRALDYLISPSLTYEKEYKNINISFKTGYSLGRVLRNFSYEVKGGDTLVSDVDLTYKEINPKGINLEFLIGFNLKRP
ncbi:MAG: hypothetical protein ABDH37_00770 [Candidatus Hydrothermales bacterium]